MSGCAGPYTRVFFEEKEANNCRRLAESLGQAAMTVGRVHLPRGRGGLDDLACDIDFTEPGGASWRLSLAKFLGPKKLLGHGHVFEATLMREAADGRRQGHLFATRLSTLADDVLAALPPFAAGEEVEDLVAREEAHEVRILMCAGEE